MNLIRTVKRWNHRRLQRRLKKKQACVARFWDQAIRDYYAGELPHYVIKPKQDLGSETIIWQYWGQGFEPEQLPELIRVALKSVEQHKGNCRLIRISDETISDYIDFPDFYLRELRDNPALKPTFSSDLLRLALLEAYGGVWLDATILLTGELPERYLESEFFAFQLPEDQPHQDYWREEGWRVCCWDDDFLVRFHSAVMFAHRGSEIISTLLDLMLYYWSVPGREIPYYHFFQVLFNRLVQEGPLKQLNCPRETYTDMESLMVVAKGHWPKEFGTAGELLRRVPIHKLSYKLPKYNERLKEILREEGVIDRGR